MPTDDILLDCEDRMDKAAEFFHHELRGIRTGRASTGLVEFIKVEYYGTPTDLRQLASIAAPEPDMILIKPFDPGSVKDIEKAILASDLGITPQSDGRMIRLPVPTLSGDRRRQLVVQIKKLAEQARVAVRNVRRDANKTADGEKDQSILTEDDAVKCKEGVQKLTDEYGKKIDDALDAKTKEIMEQ